MTYFRNWLTGFRSKFTDYLNSQVVDDSTSGSPRRAAAAHAFAYWHSFIGNVLGMAGKVGNWTYNCTGGRNQIPGNCIWDLGLVDIAPQGWDLQLAPLTIQDGNYDYLTNAIHWAANDTAHTLPDSLYLASKPAFFGGSCQWPWVNPVTGTTAPLPAKARYDAGTPNNTSSCGTAPPPPPTPTASLTANPTSITAGQSSTLTWGSANATSCNGGGFSTGGTVSGSTSVSPAQTTAYSLSCVGAGGSASAAATVTVGTVPPPPGTFQVGAQVVTTSATPVRSKAGAKAGSKLRCTQPSGATGSIVGGPQTNQGTWWNINYSSGCDGWSPESDLSLAK